MFTVLNLKVGSRVTFRDPASGQEVDAEVAEFPKIIRVKLADGTLRDLRPEDVVTTTPEKTGSSRFPSRFHARV
jgi:hypothetical protein